MTRPLSFLLPFCLFVLICSPTVFAQEPTEVDDNNAWYDTSTWEIEGKGWKDTSTPFTRMPLRAKESVPASVWNLAQHSAGLTVRFTTDARTIRVRHELSGNMTMPHMTTVGSSGIDLYARDDQGLWRWAGASRPGESKYESPLFQNASPGKREYMLYLPLYNTTQALSIGVPKNTFLEMLPPSPKKPIFYYGTSIAHGCSASRPGMTVPGLLGRRFDRPVINFGFSGNGRMEIEMAKLIGEVDAEIFVLDCLPNMTFDHVKDRTEAFVRELRKLRPDAPIVMVEDRTLSNAWLLPQWLENQKNKRTFYRSVYDKLVEEGMTGLTYVEGDDLFGDDGDGTVDGSHPTDLGMVRMTDVLQPVLQKILEKKK